MKPVLLLVAAGLATALLFGCDGAGAPAAPTPTPTPRAAALDVSSDQPIDLPDPSFAIDPQGLCNGREPQWSDVEAFKGDAEVAGDYVRRFADSTVLFQWLSDDEMRDVLTGQEQPQDPTLDLGSVPGARWCSGTLLARGRVLTAAHCFDELTRVRGYSTPRWRRGARPELVDPYRLATLMRVVFNYQVDANGQERPTESYRVARLSEYSSARGRVDYAIVELSDPRATLRRHAPAVVDRNDLRDDEQAVIIQHPAGQHKKLHHGIVWLGANGLTRYHIDTLGGSSGAGLRDLNGVIRGVHVLGGCQSNGASNAATPVSAIWDISPFLQSLP